MSLNSATEHDRNRSSAAPHPRRVRRAVMFVCIALAALLYGYDLGMMAGAILFIQHDLHLSDGMVGLFVSIVTAGTVGGMLVVGRISDRFGRRPTLMAAAVVLGLAALGMAWSDSGTPLIVFRVLMGLGLAGITAVVPAYLAELAPTQRRGAVTSLHQLMLATGTLLAFVVDYVLADWEAWRVIIGIGAVLAALVVIGMLFQPESPRWLLRQGREDEARAVLRICAPGEEDEVVAQLRGDSGSRQRGGRLVELFRNRSLRRVLLIGCAMAALQQLIGINTIVYYAPKILQSVGFGQSAAIMNSVGLGLLSVIATAIEARVVDRVGRRRLLLLGAALMATAMAALGLVFLFSFQSQAFGKGVSVLALAVFKFAYSLSWGPLLYVTLPEIFPLHLRGAGVSFSALWAQVAIFLVTLLFPIMLAAGASLIFFLFAVMGVVAYVFAAKLLSELSRKSLETIEHQVLHTGAGAAEADGRG
ncbi:sugar porter family MFS transporter [Streptomyces odontomachi]|uniref:sugar porter family MFS transporter n=1 Tax=Streptomyces odontomachi TaxID=2944940 RepID=UPI002109E2ED|nr:sugar porter family MFS transporter [Streptomyces sp. ODS25]